jgi:predicted DNA binding CopG/RHH family protein
MKKTPKFKTEKEEHKFWSKHDSTEYINYAKGMRALFPNLKPSVRTISVRLPEYIVDALKVLGHKVDVPYQSLMKMFLAERIEQELHPSKA